MSTNNFYTWFWIAYFPLCMAFYKMSWVPNWVDEAMTLLLLGFTALKFRQSKENSIKNEIWVYIGIMLLYLVYSYIRRVNIIPSVFLDFQQQVRPYVVFYCTWLLAPRFTRKQQNYILWGMYATIGLYLLYGGRRSEDVVIGQLCLNCALIYYLFKPQARRNAIICILIATLGLLSSKSKYYGEYVVLIAIIYFLKDRLKVNSLKTGTYVAVLAMVIIYFTWEKFNAYYVQGFDSESVDYRLARPETYKTAMTIIFKDYMPLGSGLGTFATNAAAEYYSPLYYKYNLSNVWGLSPEFNVFMADTYYPTLAEYGIVGVFLFLWFWKRRLWAIQKLPLKYYKVGAMAFMALALESVADTSYLSGKGMGYFMLLGIVMSVGTQIENEKKKIGVNVNDNGKENDNVSVNVNDSH